MVILAERVFHGKKLSSFSPMTFPQILKKFHYNFPKDLIANAPSKPRDAAKLLVYNRKTKKTAFDTYQNIQKYLPKGSVLVFNRTKVVPARLTVNKPTGGKAKLLYIDIQGKNIRFMSNRKLKQGEKLFINKKLYLTVAEKLEKYYLLKPSFPVPKLFSILEKYGTTPIPPYIKHTPLSEKKLRKEYQTVFAQTRGSIAAPTASLHFTKGLLNSLKRRGVKIHFVTLHVNLGTFAPLTENNILSGKLHKEYFEINKKTIQNLNIAKKNGSPIFAVGTTVVRTLESAANTKGELKLLAGTTDLFIQGKYHFKFINGLITNFHVPKSSLLMLVSAFLGREKLLEIYQLAIKKRFRLFSFGDGMLIT